MWKMYPSSDFCLTFFTCGLNLPPYLFFLKIFVASFVSAIIFLLVIACIQRLPAVSPPSLLATCRCFPQLFSSVSLSPMASFFYSFITLLLALHQLSHPIYASSFTSSPPSDFLFIFPCTLHHLHLLSSAFISVLHPSLSSPPPSFVR